MTQTSFGDISRASAAYVVVESLTHAGPITVVGKFGKIVPMPKNKGEKIIWNRPVPFAVATTPLTEGVTPTAKAMAYVHVEATLQEYGDLVQHSSKMAELAAEPSGNVALQDISRLLGEQAAETMETLTINVIKAGTNVFYDTAAHTARTSVDAAITIGRQQAVTRSLKASRGKKITEILEGSIRVGTKPVEAAYIALAHTDLEYDIRAMTGFRSVSEYGSMKPVCPEEIGVVNDVRYVLTPLLTAFADGGATSSTMVSTTGTKADVYPVIYLAKEAFAIVPLSGKEAIMPSVIASDTISKSDMLGQRGYAAWRTWFAAAITNQTWLARLEVGATKL
jgi:N4-gp56 family major capsid protein